MQFGKLMFLLPAIVCALLCSPVFAEFIDNGDGTITDTCGGLMWQKSSSEPNTPKPRKYCANLSLGGYSDWRLPTAKELSIILDSSIKYPGSASTATGPGDTRPFNYFTSSLMPNGYIVFFYSGSAHSAKEREAAETIVRCVRDLP